MGSAEAPKVLIIIFYIMKKYKFESIKKDFFKPIEVEKMKRIKGGYTLNTLTVYSSGSYGDDGTACDDDVCND